MLPEVLGLDKRNHQPERAFDFVQHKEYLSDLQRCLEIWRKRMRTEEVLNELECFVCGISEFEQREVCW